LKYQGEALLDYQYIPKKIKDKMVKQVFSRGRYQWDEVGIKK
jgi:hypothetical protein